VKVLLQWLREVSARVRDIVIEKATLIADRLAVGYRPPNQIPNLFARD
jgi:hypothetical protein